MMAKGVFLLAALGTLCICAGLLVTLEIVSISSAGVQIGVAVPPPLQLKWVYDGVSEEAWAKLSAETRSMIQRELGDDHNQASPVTPVPAPVKKVLEKVMEKIEKDQSLPAATLLAKKEPPEAVPPILPVPKRTPEEDKQSTTASAADLSAQPAAVTPRYTCAGTVQEGKHKGKSCDSTYSGMLAGGWTVEKQKTALHWCDVVRGCYRKLDCPELCIEWDADMCTPATASSGGGVATAAALTPVACSSGDVVGQMSERQGLPSRAGAWECALGDGLPCDSKCADDGVRTRWYEASTKCGLPVRFCLPLSNIFTTGAWDLTPFRWLSLQRYDLSQMPTLSSIMQGPEKLHGRARRIKSFRFVGDSMTELFWAAFKHNLFGDQSSCTGPRPAAPTEFAAGR